MKDAKEVNKSPQKNDKDKSAAPTKDNKDGVK